jgi:hypothetical protein
MHYPVEDGRVHHLYASLRAHGVIESLGLLPPWGCKPSVTVDVCSPTAVQNDEPLGELVEIFEGTKQEQMEAYRFPLVRLTL